MFTKPQDVLTCFDGSVKPIHGVNVPWELKNQAESLALNRARFKCILGYAIAAIVRAFRGLDGHSSVSS